MVQPGNDTCNIRTLLAQSCFNTVGILQHSVIVVKGSVGMYQLYIQYVYVYQLYMQYVYVYQLYIQYVYVYQLYICIQICIM